MELNNEPIRLILWIKHHVWKHLIQYLSYVYVYRDEEAENGMALMPKKPGKEEPPADDDYDPYKHRNVPHPTS